MILYLNPPARSSYVANKNCSRCDFIIVCIFLIFVYGLASLFFVEIYINLMNDFYFLYILYPPSDHGDGSSDAILSESK